MDEQYVELESLSALYIAREQYPITTGLVSLENYLLGSTSISQEGLFSKIGDLYNRIVDKTVVRLNKIIFFFTRATEKEEHTLNKMNKGDYVDPSDVNLPVSRESVVNIIKFTAGVIAWVGTTMMIQYFVKEYRDAGIKHKEKARFEKEANRVKDSIGKNKPKMDKKKASREKISMFKTLKNIATKLRDALGNINMENIKKAFIRIVKGSPDGMKTFKKTQRSKIVEYLKAPAHVANVYRKSFRAVVIVTWLTLTSWLVGKVMTFFNKVKHFFDFLPADKKPEDNDNDSHYSGSTSYSDF